MRDKNPFLIILVTTLIIFFGYHYSKDKIVQTKKANTQKTQTAALVGVTTNEATVKDWDRLFQKIIDKMG